MIGQELEAAQRICETLGDSELTNELWTEVVAASDGLSRYLEHSFRLRTLALESGISSTQWYAIRKGKTS
ncbi:hypothetical protein G419_16203 [Rhodococcus triatomae BKS 15-14]|nr:hypothetical protein G419_16203 [Rhodococcus triatomae BKS 15-14]